MQSIAWMNVPLSVLFDVVSDILENISKNKYLAIFLAFGVLIASLRIFRNIKRIS